MRQTASAVRHGVPLYWASINMRAGMVVLSPIIVLVGRDLGLGTIELAWLTSIPVLCFAFASPLTTVMRRFGTVDQIITAALWLLGASLLLRASGTTPALYLFTVGMGVGIATLNVMLPIWVKQYGGEHSGLLTGIYVAMMSVTTSIGIAVASPLAHASNLGWRLALLPWGVVALISAAWWQRRVNTLPREDAPAPADIDVRMFLHSRLAWQVTLVFGLQSMNAYASRAWLPTVMLTKGFTMASAGTTVAVAGLIGGAMAMAVPHLAQRSTDQRPALWGISLLTAAAYAGVYFGSHMWVVVWVVASNIGQWCAYPLALLLIILRSENPLHAQSLSAMVQMVGYLMGACAPLIAGALFDATGTWRASLLVMAGVAVAQAVVGHGAGRIGHVRRRDTVQVMQAGAL